MIYNAPYGNTAYAYFDYKSYGNAIPSGQTAPYIRSTASTPKQWPDLYLSTYPSGTVNIQYSD